MKCLRLMAGIASLSLGVLAPSVVSVSPASASTPGTCPSGSVPAGKSGCRPLSVLISTGPNVYQIRPKTMSPFCMVCEYLTGLEWKTWGPTTAEATGTLHTENCRPSCATGGHFSTPVLVYLSDIKTAAGGTLAFTEIQWSERDGHDWSPRIQIPISVPPSTTTTTAPPNVIGGQWEHVGFSGSGEAVDVVHLTLVNFPPGHLTGSWTETAAPGYQPGLALNGTECVGCNGVAGAYHDDFGVVGAIQGSTFTIEVQNDGGSTFSGALGGTTPYGATRYGCSPSVPTGEMFLVSGSSAYLFFRPQDFPGVAVGRQVSCS